MCWKLRLLQVGSTASYQFLFRIFPQSNLSYTNIDNFVSFRHSHKIRHWGIQSGNIPQKNKAGNVGCGSFSPKFHARKWYTSLTWVLTCIPNHFLIILYGDTTIGDNFQKTGQRKLSGKIIQWKKDKSAWRNLPGIWTPHPPPLGIPGANRAFHPVFTRFRFPDSRWMYIFFSRLRYTMQGLR